MSNFASALSRLMEEKKLSQAELSKRAGIAQPQISRWLNADQVKTGWLADEDFERLCKVFVKPIEQASLMRARMLDMLAGPNVAGTKLIEVSVAHEPIREAAPPLRQIINLPPKLEKDIETILNNLPNNRLVRDMITSLASHLRRKP